MAKGFGISDLASLGFGQVGQLLDTMDMMSKTWSAMALPATMDPGASIEDLDKRINDLRAIEQWLSLNQGMLRNTIQALEVQRGTLAALQSFGQSMGTSDGRTEGVAMPWDPARLAALFAAAQPPAGAPAGDAGPAGTDAAGRSDQTTASRPGPADRAPEAEAPAPDAAAAHASQLAQAWWSMLNEQFQQLASAAVGGMVPSGHAGAGVEPPAPAGDPAPARDAKRPARKPSSGSSNGRKRAPRSA